MILRLFAFTLAAALSLLAFEFFFQSILLGESYFNVDAVRVLPGTAGIVLGAAAIWRSRQKRLSDG